MKRFNKIAIIGVGLIGGSIGLAIKNKRLAKTVVGICRRKVSAKAALKAKAVDIATLSYKKGLKNTDLVIIAAPVGRIVEIAEKVAKSSDGSLILTDVGSTKEKIVSHLERSMPNHIEFVGAHPMAGSEKSGVSAASKNLFKNSICIITKTKKTDEKAFNEVKTFWKKLGTSCKILSPKDHDDFISFVSHLPHVAAIALTNAANPGSLEFASTGFKDTTRIASSNPNLWHDIFIANKDALLRALSDYRAALEGIERSIKTGNTTALIDLLKRAKTIRDSLN
ncbi:MAG: prephenate dehydrogenase [Candidatus Omnitrophica bacterium]|nr:prephenate dehydrogenase [Candidatus Omnitrophota bacterium]